MSIRMTRPAAAALALTLGLAISGCSQPVGNRSLDSVKQPVVEHSNFVLDINTVSDGLAIPEQNRLEDWFATIDLHYGDRVSIDDPAMSAATKDAVGQIAGRYGILVSDSAPVTTGQLRPGTARIVVTRSTASVPGCPDWGGKGAYNYANATHDGFGCSVNSNLAAMVANPEDLIEGQKGTGETVIMTSVKAIETYRQQTPTGSGGLSSVSTGSGGGGGN